MQVKMKPKFIKILQYALLLQNDKFIQYVILKERRTFMLIIK